jgi:hypothetical protein
MQSTCDPRISGALHSLRGDSLEAGPIFACDGFEAHALKVLMAATSQNRRLLFIPIFSVYERGCSELERAATAKAARTA